MNKKYFISTLISTGATILASLNLTPAAHALGWSVTGLISGTDPFSGTFTISDDPSENESSGTPVLVSSSFVIDGVTYNNTSSFPLPSPPITTNATGITGITWTNSPFAPFPNGCTSFAGCTLTLNFSSPLTPAGGTISLAASSVLDQSESGYIAALLTGTASATPGGGGGGSGSLSASAIPFELNEGAIMLLGFAGILLSKRFINRKNKLFS